MNTTNGPQKIGSQLETRDSQKPVQSIKIMSSDGKEKAIIRADERTEFKIINAERVSIGFFNTKLINIELWDAIQIDDQIFFLFGHPLTTQIDSNSFRYDLTLSTERKYTRGLLNRGTTQKLVYN